MKKFALLLFLLFNSCLLFAQKDTVKRMADGVVMLSSDDVIENASRSKNLSTFISLVNTAGIADTFKVKGPITVFIPDDKAFSKLNAAVYDTIMSPAHNHDLIRLLMYHAISGKITANDIAKQIRLGNGQAVLTTLSGGKLTAQIDANRNIVLTDENGGQSIISKFNIQQRNGILDVITAVLIPKM